MSKSFIFKVLVVLVLLGFSGAVVYAAISEKGSVKGTTFKVSSSFPDPVPTPTSNSALKLISNLTGGTSDSNLVDNLSGPSYDNVSPTWSAFYPMKFYNKSNETLSLIASSEYIEDANTIRDDLYVTMYEWNDVNTNGTYDNGEAGALYKRDTILSLKNDTFNLGQINGKATKNVVLKFDGEGFSSANFSQQGVFDFVFTGVTATP